MEFLELVTSDFEQLQVLRDDARGVLAFVAIHDTSCGPAFGGIRRYAYRQPLEGAQDALRLAEAMTWKCALAGVPGGGGKTVIVDLAETDREAAYSLVGQHVEEMGGRYYTGPDVGTEPSDLEVVARHTGFVARPGDAGPGNLAEPTALGVFAGIRAVAAQLGHDDLDGLRVVVQGLGEVGRRLVDRLVANGAVVTVADIDRTAVQRAVEELGVSEVDTGRVLAVEADVFAPCALGGVIHDLSLQNLRAKAVAGSANNVLAAPEHGAELHRRGVLYAPDFLINSGALIHGALFHLTGVAPPAERIEQIGTELAALLEESRLEDRPPEQIALDKARQRVAERGEGRRFMPRSRGRNGADR